MKKRFSDQQIISILREAEAGVTSRMSGYSSAANMFFQLIIKCKKNLQISLSRGNVIVYGISLDCDLCN